MTIANRVLRHNVRNEMNVVLAQTEHLENELGESPEPLEAIQHHAKEVVELGEDAREISRNADIRGDDAVVDVVPVVESIVADGPDIVSLADDIPDRAEAEVTERKFYETAFEELVENAIEHNDGPDPEVVVDVTTTEAEVTVTVADNGPGIPEGERKVLRQGRETALHHGSGLGLWLVYWFAVAADG